MRQLVRVPCGAHMTHVKGVIIVLIALNEPILTNKTTNLFILAQSPSCFQCGTMCVYFWLPMTSYNKECGILQLNCDPPFSLKWKEYVAISKWASIHLISR